MFHVATSEEIKSGRVSDIYFSRTVEVLKAKGIDKQVKAEIRASSLPLDWNWSVLAGMEEAAQFLEGMKVNVLTMEEGTVFHAEEPILLIEGNYLQFATAETSLLGYLCQASGIATKAARCKKAAGDKRVISFGARRMHPALAPMIERSAFIGGCDGVAVIKSAELIGEEPMGTMPHSLVLLVGDSVEAFRLFHEIVSPKVKRVALVDTLIDEKFESIGAAEAMGKELFAVRLDTPGSRKGDMKEILEEVRWELDLRGFKDTKLFVSGGVDEYEIAELNSVADAYGVGTSISNAPVINFSLDIVEVEGKPLAKRGKKSGGKQALRCQECFKTLVLPQMEKKNKCQCQGKLLPLLKPLIEDGKIVRELPRPQVIREYVLNQLERVELTL